MSFATHSDLSTWLGIDFDASQQTRATELLAVASRLIVTEVGHPIEETTETVTLDADGGEVLLLPDFPVTAVASVVEDGTTLTVDDDYRWSAAGILYRVDGCWPDKPRSVDVEYTHGFPADADDLDVLKDIACAVAARAWGNPEAASSKSYANRQSMWAKGLEGMTLTDAEKGLLDRFRG